METLSSRLDAPVKTPPSSTLLYLSRHDVASLELSFEEMLPPIERAFAEKGLGLIESPPKRGLTPGNDASIRAMKAHVPSAGAIGVKWISAYPQNVARGLPTIQATVILNDPENGLPIAILDGSWITGHRTAVSTAIACKHLARPESSTVGVIACGLQGRTNLRALTHGFPIERVFAYDKSPETAAEFARTLGPELDLEINAVPTVREAVEGVDILVSSMPIEKDPTPPIAEGWLGDGTLACLLDYDAAMSGPALRACDRLVTDDCAQMDFFKEIGYFRETPEPDADLGKIVAGRQTGRRNAQEKIACMNLGIGFLDIVTASLILARAKSRGVGTVLPY